MHVHKMYAICAAGKFNQLVYNYPIRIPERFSLVIRSLLTQEGICFTLKPDFKFLEVRTYFFLFFVHFVVPYLQFMKLATWENFFNTNSHIYRKL